MAAVAADAVTGLEPWHRFDVELARHYTARIGAGVKSAIGDLTPFVHAYVTRARGTHTRLPQRAAEHPDVVVKAFGAHGDPAAQGAARQAAKEALKAFVRGDTGPLLEVLEEMYGDAYIAGAHATLEAAIAAGQSGAVIASGFAALDGQVDWSHWTPGWGQAANELSGGAGGRGLSLLLQNANVTIRGIVGTTLDRLAALLAEGVETGASIDTIAKTLTAYVGSAVRAQMIAVTEVARAMTVASIDTMRANGIAQWNWVLTPGACEFCEGMNASNPHLLDDDSPPGHPNCRCVASPVVVTSDGSLSPDYGE